MLITISDFITSIKEAYEFGKTIKNDIDNYKEKKKSEKIETRIIKIRDFVGKVDSILTKHVTDLKTAKQSGLPEIYGQHVSEFRTSFKEVQGITNLISALQSDSYFDQFPELREKLMFKTGMECSYPKMEERMNRDLDEIIEDAKKRIEEKDKEDQDRYYGKYSSYENFIIGTQNATRDVLNSLNAHIERLDKI